MTDHAWLHAQGRVERLPGPPLLVFDGECGFCRATVLRLQARWPEARVRYLPCQDPDVRRLVPALSQARCETAVTLVTADGTIYQGADVAPLFWQLRDGGERPLAGLWRLPGLLPVLRLGYGWIARHRAGISQALGTLDTPPVPPTRRAQSPRELPPDPAPPTD